MTKQQALPGADRQRARLRQQLRRVFSNRSKRLSRSKSGDVLVTLFIAAAALFSVIPLVLSISNSLKPINELFVYPPTIFPRHPTFDNFRMLFSLMSSTWVPFSRYIFNTVFVTLMATAGHVLFASMAAYPLSKHAFPGKRLLNSMVMLSLMFVPTVADVANYLTISWLGWLNSYTAMILPYIGSTLGLFLMTNYMTTIPTTLLEAAKIDGCSELKIYWKIVMPLVKPAWLTLVIIMFQTVWGQWNNQYVYLEQMKTLPYALSQIVTGGFVRAGAGQAVAVLMLLVPAVVFIVNQSNMLETMASSGIKE